MDEAICPHLGVAQFKVQYNVTIGRVRSPLILTCITALVATAGCSRKEISVSTPPGALKRDNSFVDLEPGWTVRIVMPLLKSGTVSPGLVEQKSTGNTISLSAENLIGYTTAHYAVAGKKGAGVRLAFMSAEETRNAETLPMSRPPTLPFALPNKTEHVRLIYLVRASQADHNMAIAGAKRIEALNAFTSRLIEDPTACQVSSAIFCSWVPAGIAVRPENR